VTCFEAKPERSSRSKRPASPLARVSSQRRSRPWQRRRKPRFALPAPRRSPFARLAHRGSRLEAPRARKWAAVMYSSRRSPSPHGHQPPRCRWAGVDGDAMHGRRRMYVMLNGVNSKQMKMDLHVKLYQDYNFSTVRSILCNSSVGYACSVAFRRKSPTTAAAVECFGGLRRNGDCQLVKRLRDRAPRQQTRRTPEGHRVHSQHPPPTRKVERIIICKDARNLSPAPRRTTDCAAPVTLAKR
jgi:hypothetical protein